MDVSDVSQAGACFDECLDQLSLLSIYLNNTTETNQSEIRSPVVEDTESRLRICRQEVLGVLADPLSPSCTATRLLAVMRQLHSTLRFRML